MKTCNKCKTAKETSDFYVNKRMKDGYNTFCICCHKLDNVTRKTKNRNDLDFKSKELAYKKEYRSRTVEQRSAYMKEWHEKNAIAQIEYRKQYRVDNLEYFKIYCQKNKHKLNANVRKYQVTKLQRTPKWLSDTNHWMIEEAYELALLRTKITGFSWHVDHIIPLQGKTVSGLHTPYNLQVIPALENWAKNNKFEVSI